MRQYYVYACSSSSSSSHLQPVYQQQNCILGSTVDLVPASSDWLILTQWLRDCCRHNVDTARYYQSFPVSECWWGAVTVLSHTHTHTHTLIGVSSPSVMLIRHRGTRIKGWDSGRSKANRKREMILQQDQTLHRFDNWSAESLYWKINQTYFTVSFVFKQTFWGVSVFMSYNLKIWCFVASL